MMARGNGHVICNQEVGKKGHSTKGPANPQLGYVGKDGRRTTRKQDKVA